MAYALFCQDSKISRSYATWAEVWDHASESGLVIDLPEKEAKAPKQVLSNDYEIRSCEADTDDSRDKKPEQLQKYRAVGRQ